MMLLIQATIQRYRRMNRAGGAESGIALLTALFFMVLVAGLSLVLLGVILGQTTQGYVEQKNTKTVYAAQAGLQATLGILRSAALPPDGGGNVFGNVSKLPCTVTGYVDGNGVGTGYSVSVAYYTEDPLGHDDFWRLHNKLPHSGTCITSLPKYALINSTGTGLAVPGNANPLYGNRTLSAVYKFKVSNINISGGQILNNNQGFCLSADTATAGAAIHFLPVAQCLNNDLELWVYDLNYQIQLASTGVNNAAGLCITGPVVDGQGTQDALLQPCLTKTDPLRWNQLWSWTGDYSWRGQKQIIANGPSTYCLSPDAADGSDLTGKNLEIRNGCKGTFDPTAQVGAGPAGYLTHQIVNYKEFGRCADLTNENLSSTFMISYPCKQDPTGTGDQLHWNHKWYYQEPTTGSTWVGQVYVNYNNNPAQKYCLNGPTTGSDIYFTTCNTSAQQVWTRVYNTGDYSTSYLFIDYQRHCMATDPTSLFHGYISEIKMQICSGSLAQKWNAPPTYDPSSFGGFREIAG
jgi:hypothetical protein